MKYCDICGIPFKIIYAAGSLGGVNFGECCAMKSEITINSDCSDDQKSATLVHEWMHGVAGCNGVDDSEELVSIVSTELYRQGFRVATYEKDDAV